MIERLPFNCSKIVENVFNCSTPLETNFGNGSLFITAYCTLGSLSAIGFIFNSVASYIFAFSMNIGNSRFLQFLRIYTFNCTLINLNDLVSAVIQITTVTVNKPIYLNSVDHLITSQFYMIYFTYFAVTIWSLTYTFSGLLDLMIVYQQILLYLPTLNFLRQKSVSCISLTLLAYTFMINVPIYLSRDHAMYELNFNGNQTVAIYSRRFKEYQYQNVFRVATYISLGLRDILQLLLNIYFNVALTVTLIRFLKRKTSMLGQQQSRASSKTNWDNTKIAAISCVFSSILHLIASLPILTYSMNLSREFNARVVLLLGLLNILKHSSNFFVLLKLNKKFRDAFMMKKKKTLEID